MAKNLSDDGSGFSSRRIEFKADLHPRAVPRGLKPNRTRILHRSAGQGLPGDKVRCFLMNNFCIPFDALAKRTSNFPSRAGVTVLLYRSNMSHHLRQLFQIPPETKKHIRRPPNLDPIHDLDPPIAGNSARLVAAVQLLVSIPRAAANPASSQNAGARCDYSPADCSTTSACSSQQTQTCDASDNALRIADIHFQIRTDLLQLWRRLEWLVGQ